MLHRCAGAKAEVALVDTGWTGASKNAGSSTRRMVMRLEGLGLTARSRQQLRVMKTSRAAWILLKKENKQTKTNKNKQKQTNKKQNKKQRKRKENKKEK